MVKEHIRILIPTTDDVVTNDIAALCEAAVSLNGMEDVPWKFSVKRYNNAEGVAYARNWLIEDGLSTDAERFWFIDQDTRPSQNSFELPLLPYDIAAAVYPAFQKTLADPIGSITFGAYRKEGDDWAVDPLPEDGNPIMEVDGVMMGATIIRRKVLEDPRMLLDTSDTPRAWFRTPTKANGKRISTEDLDFCIRAKEAGFTVGVHSGIKWDHLKKIGLMTVARMMMNAFERGLDYTPNKIEVAS